MSRNSSPAMLRAQHALHGTVSVPINDTFSESANSLSGAANVSSGSVARDQSGSDGTSGGAPASRRSGGRRMSMQDAIDVSKFDMKLYSERRRKNTLTLVDAINEETREEAPHMDFTLRYDKESRSLALHVLGTSDMQPFLAAINADVEGGQLNPYCRVQLTPHAAEQQLSVQGKALKGTSSPLFDEQFLFELESSEIGLKTLQISLFHEDPLRAVHVCVGHVLFSLSNLQFNQVLPFRRPLVAGPPVPTDSESPCCILFSLAYLVGAERITVTITKATNLRCTKGRVQCKVTVQSAGGAAKKKKTSAMRILNSTAELQEALTFSVNRKVIQQTKLRIELLQKATFQKSRSLGRLDLGPDSTGYAYAHWNDMVNCKDSLPRWHQLLCVPEKNNNGDLGFAASLLSKCDDGAS